MKLWTSLLFLHGHIVEPSLARSLAGDDAPAEAPAQPARARAGSTRRRRARPHTSVVTRLLRNLEYLGGRPMTAGHNDDIEEPFPQSIATAPAKRSTRSTRSKPCVTRHGAIAAVCGTVALSPFR